MGGTRGPRDGDDAAAGWSGKSLRVVVFTGGRGSRVLSEKLVDHPGVRLTLAVNGYDDGKSTGEVRRLLPGMLGPSDYRKNANRIARMLGSCPEALVRFLAHRIPPGTTYREGVSVLDALSDPAGPSATVASPLGPEAGDLPGSTREELAERLVPVVDLLEGRPDDGFDFSDCAMGNLVFAGCYLCRDRDFNAAVEDYASGILGLPSGMIQNVTSGENAHLVALTRDNRLLPTEADLVDAARPSDIRDFYLIEPRLDGREQKRLSGAPVEEVVDFLEARRVEPRANPSLLRRLEEADLVIYAPGTQHSSLYPSYVAPGIGRAIASNLGAVKLLITNLQRDAEIPDESAVDIVERATYYLRGRNAARIPVPCLITHFLINEPEHPGSESPYVPLGPVETLDDPRLVRIGDYEDAATGRHDARKVLQPYISMLLEDPTPSVGVLLLEATSPDKISQTMLEAYRGGIGRAPVACTFFYWSEEPLPRDFTADLPFGTHNLYTQGESPEASFAELCAHQSFDYVILFESSGMYRGEDVVSLAHHLTWKGLDAVWGSRRLSVKDIHASYRFRYSDDRLLGLLSYVGSHALSLAYLLLYGRYVSDTLSGVRAVRGRYLRGGGVDLSDKRLNHHLLSTILAGKGALFETPVRFVPISPEKVRRTTVGEGVRSLFAIVGWRLRSVFARTAGVPLSRDRGVEPPEERRAADVADPAAKAS